MAHLGQLISLHGLLYRTDAFIQRVTSKLVKEVLTDVPKVVVDYAFAPKKEKKHVDTGGWKKIHKGQEVPEKSATAGLNLMLEGVSMKKPKRPTVKIQNFSLDK